MGRLHVRGVRQAGSVCPEFPNSVGEMESFYEVGGDEPHWRKDGKEIFFVTQDRKLWSVAVKSAQSTFEAAVPQTFFLSPDSGAPTAAITPAMRCLPMDSGSSLHRRLARVERPPNH